MARCETLGVLLLAGNVTGAQGKGSKGMERCETMGVFCWAGNVTGALQKGFKGMVRCEPHPSVLLGRQCDWSTREGFKKGWRAARPWVHFAWQAM